MIIDVLRENYGIKDIEVLVPRKHGSFIDALNDRNIKWYGSLYFGVTSSIRNDGKDWLRILKVYGGYVLETVLSWYYALKFRHSNFDLVYTNTRGPILGAKIAKKLHNPHIIHVREFGAEKSLFGFWGYKKMYNMSDRLIFISNALKDEYARYVPEDKLVVIPNGINSPLGLPFHVHKGESSFNLLLTGRLVPDKGHRDAILAMAIIKNKGIEDVHLYIAGSLQANMYIGWYEEELKKLISDNDLENYVTFCGEISDMVSLREKMDVELMTAIKETFGRVTIEGMRSGLVLIGSNTGGTVELIEDGINGLLYQQGNETDLAEKILKVYNSPEYAEQLARAGYEYTQTHYTAEENVRRVYDVISIVTKKG
jgi:glycosyltransferase involved in cell wall biosynthesis